MKTARAPIEMTVFEPVSYENKDKHFFFFLHSPEVVSFFHKIFPKLLSTFLVGSKYVLEGSFQHRFSIFSGTLFGIPMIKCPHKEDDKVSNEKKTFYRNSN